MEKLDDLEKQFSELDKDSILTENVIETVLMIPNAEMKERYIATLENRARELKISQNFKRLFKSIDEKINKQKNVKNVKKEEKITHDKVANILMLENNLVVFENDVCIYEDGVFKRAEEIIYKKIIQINPNANTYFRKEVYNYLLLIAPQAFFNRESGYINFKNGLYDINKKILIEHTPSIFTMNQIPHEYNPEAKEHELLKETLMKIACYKLERYNAILQMIGYCMTTSIHLQKCFILYGKTAGNGKSTLQNIITALIGQSNVSVIPLDELTNNKFASGAIKGKLVDMGSEMSKEYLKDVSTFKQWVTGDEIAIEEKFKAKQKINPYAKFIFNANELPKVSDKTDGFYRRLHIILMEAKFNKSENKVFKFSDIVTEEAMEWLLKESLQAFLNMDDFANIDESDEIINKYKIENNSVLMYIQDLGNIKEIIKKNGYSFKRNILFSDYKWWCEDSGYQRVGKTTFYNYLKSVNGITFNLLNGYDLVTFDKKIYLI
mgnify:CR=1 FL=1